MATNDAPKDTARDAALVVACVQMRSSRDPAANRDAAINGIREAADAGAVYIQTPEMTSLLVRDRKELFAKAEDQTHDPLIAAAREVAREKRVTVHLGSLPLLEGDRIANRAIVIDPKGEIAATYDKIHLFDVDLPNGESWRESATYAGGHQAVTAPLAVGEDTYTLGVSICYDLRFPYLYRALAEVGAVILTAPACFTRQTGEAHWQVLQRARAIENGAFMISAAQGGTHDDGRHTWGHSIIVDPWGRVMAEGGSEPGIILASIDPAMVAQVRAQIPSLRHTQLFSLPDSNES
ncbi:carbon-nitrogen hydrolase family protein [Pseudochelatococcus contaminans]|uniref:Putative amidohydrolase n=1 Tax=Pseudochelatococcus contaminans TaxID=1538103 RepID=A0A7W5Z2C7_9HYPH|nr:carbon-nitrogen hydrolase family protein [Pseudochelatococcus contaminans]MBB3808811.1 putative amidohydrolase [Pseudochelatococcus contaminans]